MSAGFSPTISTPDAEVESVKANTFTRFPPKPEGKTNLSVYDCEIVPFTKNESSPYFGESALALEFVGSVAPYDIGRFFVRVPLFTNWKPSTEAKKLEKWPNGFPTHMVSFLKAVTGGTWKVGDNVFPEQYLGVEINARIVVEPDTYGLNRDIASEEPDALELVELRESGEDAERLEELEFLYSRNSVDSYLPLNVKDKAIAKAGKKAAAKKTGIEDVEFDE